jgi:hypothetical protein
MEEEFAQIGSDLQSAKEYMIRAQVYLKRAQDGLKCHFCAQDVSHIIDAIEYAKNIALFNARATPEQVALYRRFLTTEQSLWIMSKLSSIALRFKK